MAIVGIMAFLIVAALTGCERKDPLAEWPKARSEDGTTLYVAKHLRESCVDGFVAITSTHQSWWKLDKQTRMPIRCEELK